MELSSAPTGHFFIWKKSIFLSIIFQAPHCISNVVLCCKADLFKFLPGFSSSLIGLNFPFFPDNLVSLIIIGSFQSSCCFFAQTLTLWLKCLKALLSTMDLSLLLPIFWPLFVPLLLHCFIVIFLCFYFVNYMESLGVGQYIILIINTFK